MMFGFVGIGLTLKLFSSFFVRFMLN
jgi:hypothetical protein